MTIQGVARLLTLAKMIYPNTDASEKSIFLWKSFLSEYPDEVGLAAMHQCLKTKEFPPKPADIIRIAETMRKDQLPLAEDAWREVSLKLNPYQKPKWSHPLIEQAVKSLGYSRLCTSQSPEYDHSQFIKTYEKYKERSQQEERNRISFGNTPTLAQQVLGNGRRENK